MERRTFLKSTGAIGFATLITPFGIIQSNRQVHPQDDLAEGFGNPPASAKPHTWWHWMNGNVSKEGITLDLEAMARVGIGGVQNFDAGTGIPKGPVIYLSNEWLELKKHAIREAERLGLEFTMHNCPGWSSSGGPWITPELSMQEVTWSELVVVGGKSVKVALPKPFRRLDHYRDIAVLALRSLPGEYVVSATMRVRSNTENISAEKVTGENPKPIRIVPSADTGRAFIEFQFTQPFEIRQIEFITAAYGENKGPISLDISNDGKVFTNHATFNTGSFSGEPRGEVVVSQHLEPFKTAFVRLSCAHERHFSQIRFSGLQKPDGWEQRANYAFNRFGVGELERSIPSLDKQDIVDLTDSIQPDGTLAWNAPAGTWTIIRFGYTTTGSLNRSAPDTGIGLECDKFSAQAFDIHFSKMMENLLPFLDTSGEKNRAGLLIDSYEVGMQNWTPGFEAIFREKAGYDILGYLPALTGRVVSDTDETDRFLRDLRRVQADLMADNYYGRFNELCHKNNLISYIQPYDRGPMEEMQIGARVDINVGEFWNGLSSIFQNNRTMRRTVKLSAAIAHTNGQRIVAAEAFTGEPESSRWQEHPFALKVLGDRMFADGLNRMVFHRFAHQPHPTAMPGMTMGPWGSHFDRTNTWWEKGKSWMQYLTRCQFLLQQGHFVADLAYFTGEEAGVYTSVGRDELVPPPPEGFDYDLINAESLISKAKVVDKRLVLPDGMSYSILLLQNHKRMSLVLLSRIKAFVDEGLVVLGEPPISTLGLIARDDRKFGQLVEELWSSGKILSNSTLAETLERSKLGMDFSYTSASGDAPLKHIHRRADGADIYFIANQRRNEEKVVVTFRVGNRQPEIWEPVSGKIFKTAIFEHEKGSVRVPLTLEPFGSVFVVFRNNAPGNAVVSVKHNGTEVISTKEYISQRNIYPGIENTFSISMWVKPENNIMLTTNNFMDGQEPWTDFYALYPSPGEALYGPGHSTLGLAVGRNGVAIWENASGRPVFAGSVSRFISGWTNVTLVCVDSAVTVYVGGEPLKSIGKSKYVMHPGGGSAYLTEGASFFNGDITTPEVSGEALSAARVKDLATQRPTDPAPWSPVVIDQGDHVLAFRTGEVMVREKAGRARSFKIKVDGQKDISENWQVIFPAGYGAPDRIDMTKLNSLHQHATPGVKFFSGTCVYSKMFEGFKKRSKNSKRYFLDLGVVEVIAEVVLNKRSIGILWARPFVIDITEHLLEGENRLEIHVTNLWPNRLIGDEQAPVVNKYSPGGGGSGFASLAGGAILELPEWYKNGEPKPEDGRVTFATWQHYTSDAPLLQSGLIGPVLIRTAEAIKLD